MTKNNKMSKQPITSEVYAQLKLQIVELILMPGQILMVQQLSKELGISRTPVREAMVRLCDDGLVEECDGRKFRVTSITWSMLDDVYEVRQALEGQALAELASRITPVQCAQLKKQIVQMTMLIGSANPAQYFAADNKFHRLLLQMHGNMLIMDFIDRIKDHQQRIRFLTSSIRGRMVESVAEHEAIVACLERGDGEAARTALMGHLTLARNEVKELLQNQFSRFLVRDE